MKYKIFYIKKQRKTAKRSPRKISKSFWRRKKKAKKGSGEITKFFWRRKKKWQYCCECNKNLSEDQKQRLVKYKRNYYATHKK